MRPMRKASRQKDPAWALDVMDRAPYLTVSMVRPDGTPYGVPLSVARKNDRIFYFHCAFDGEKIDCLRHNPTVSLAAVSRCTPKFEKDKTNFTEYYHSAIAIGIAEEVTGREEKIEALRLICGRFLPGSMDHFEEAIERSLDMTCVVRITLSEPPVGKCKP